MLLLTKEVSTVGNAGFLLREDEQPFAQRVGADCWDQPGRLRRQVSGKAYFTDQRVVFLAGGLFGTDRVSWEIPLSEVASVADCLSPPFLPFGIRLVMKNGNKYMLAVLGRTKYIQWLQEHIG